MLILTVVFSSGPITIHNKYIFQDFLPITFLHIRCQTSVTRTTEQTVTIVWKTVCGCLLLFISYSI